VRCGMCGDYESVLGMDAAEPSIASDQIPRGRSSPPLGRSPFVASRSRSTIRGLATVRKFAARWCLTPYRPLFGSIEKREQFFLLLETFGPFPKFES